MLFFNNFATKQNIMSKIDYYQIALYKAKELGYDTIRYCGERDGWKYFNIFNWITRGHKLGLPHIIKISADCKSIILIQERSEILWAIMQKKLHGS
jgi:hypothetical protein